MTILNSAFLVYIHLTKLNSMIYFDKNRLLKITKFIKFKFELNF